ncbi:hypothetical protein SBOR_6744 [Sclerotinia borealis F-4128]|uniref:2EXR domain-containing protein n=1 Tax=Sclerotinia borealis (strain F-4128) TaxID=1432307 RepID=W9CAK9_SCLBF|nr:hypothetical protein SBOR_6744 [Sclerotinia borealis F-4128]
MSYLVDGGTKNFTIFPNLPLELQRKIWKSASFHRRDVLVGIKYSYQMSDWVTGKWRFDRKYLFRFRSDNPVPILFMVCREARMEAKKHYKKVLVAKHTFKFFSITQVPRFYINPTSDIISPVGMDFLTRPQQWGYDCYNMDLWIERVTEPSNRVRSLVLHAEPNVVVKYGRLQGSRNLRNLSCHWDSLTPLQQCLLCSAISKFGIAIETMRRNIRRQILQDQLTEASGAPRQLLPWSGMTYFRKESVARGPLEDSRNWVDPSIQLMVDHIPYFVRKLLNFNEVLPLYQCDDTAYTVCYAPWAIMMREGHSPV